MKAHDTISEHLAGVRLSPMAIFDLLEALKNKKVRSMRRSLIDPSVRQRLSASFWDGLRIDVENNSPRFLPSLPIRRFRDFRDIHAWIYYVWELDIDMIWGKSLLDQGSSSRRRGNTRIDPSRRTRRNPTGRSGATASTGAAQPAQPRQPEQPEPEQLPQPTIRPRRVGTPPLLSPEEIAAGKEYCNQQLDANPTWVVSMGGKQNACGDIIVNEIPKLRNRAEKCWRTISRSILEPVLAERQTIG